MDRLIKKKGGRERGKEYIMQKTEDSNLDENRSQSIVVPYNCFIQWNKLMRNMNSIDKAR